MTDLLAGNPESGVANAVNDRGSIAGTHGAAVIVWNDGAGTSLGIVGEPQDINASGGTLGNTVNAANGVNDGGIVVGYATLPFGSTIHAVVWEDGVLRDLGTLGGTDSFAVDINNRGLILGSADAPDDLNHMVTWNLRSGLLHDHGPRLAGRAN